MKTFLIITAICSVMALANSCSSPAFVQKDDSVSLTNYKTFMWVDMHSSENGGTKRHTAYADIALQKAVNDELEKLGWKEVKENPDVLMSYDVLVEKNTAAKTAAVSAQTVTRYYFNPFSGKWSSMYYPSQFQGYQLYETPVKEGTITITMVDAKTDKNILQGWTTEKLPEARITDEEIKRSVRNIFKDVS